MRAILAVPYLLFLLDLYGRARGWPPLLLSPSFL